MTHQEYLAARMFTGLDGLRAIAATLVVLFHFGRPRLTFLQGWIGVHVFFVLSGYLITTLALREQDRNGKVSLRSFYVRRFFRIVPVYALVLALVFAQAVFSHRGAAAMKAALPYYATFMNEYAPRAPFILSWTLGIEQKFYLVWPALAFLVAWKVWGRLLVLLGSVGILLLMWQASWLDVVHYLVLLSGAGLAVVLHHPRGFAVLRPLMTPLAAVVVGAAFVAGHLQLTRLVGSYGERAVIPLYGLGVCVLLVTVLGPGPSRWLLSRRPMAFVGERSYSLYLVQGPAHSAAIGLGKRVAAGAVR